LWRIADEEGDEEMESWGLGVEFEKGDEGSSGDLVK